MTRADLTQWIQRYDDELLYAPDGDESDNGSLPQSTHPPTTDVCWKQRHASCCPCLVAPVTCTCGTEIM